MAQPRLRGDGRLVWYTDGSYDRPARLRERGNYNLVQLGSGGNDREVSLGNHK